jgi:hypothetical protein
MNIYNCTFIGRRVGAQGVTYRIQEEVKSQTELTNKDISLILYKKYDHISQLVIIKSIWTETIGDHVDVDRDIERKFGL